MSIALHTESATTLATNEMAVASSQELEHLAARVKREETVRTLVQMTLPEELKKAAGELLDSLRTNAGVSERFDAFCCQAFSKPEWAAASSTVISEMFEDDEDRLAELARVPDVVIELGSGQAAIACTVASLWASRGETHRLARLAESIVAAHGTMKNPAAVEVMLALAATLAVTRPARAEQLFNVAMPLAEPEHAEAVADARLWLTTGKIMCSAPQEERDMWDTRLRRPRMPWKWDAPEEKRALECLGEQIKPGLPGLDKYQRIVPSQWWDQAMAKAVFEQAEQAKPVLAAASKTTLTIKTHQLNEPRVKSDIEPPTVENEAQNLPDKPTPERGRRSFDAEAASERESTLRSGSIARFVLGWACGVLAMVVTLVTLLKVAPESLYRVLTEIEETVSPKSAPQPNAAAMKAAPLTSAEVDAENKRWRENQVKSLAVKYQSIADFFYAVKKGVWKDNEEVLSGHNGDLPFANEKYMQLLVWLHVDPPEDAATLAQLPKLLLDRVDADVLVLWEKLLYPGSINAEHIRTTAQQALMDKARTWNPSDMARLREIAHSTTKDTAAAP